MKYTKQTNLIIATVVALLSALDIYGQQNNQQTTSIIGVWSFDYNSSYTNMSAESKQLIDNNATLKSQVESVYVGRKVAFNANGTYLQTLPNGNVLEGLWAYSGSKKIRIVDPSGAVLKEKIELLTPNALILKPETTGDAKSIFVQHYFIKN